MGLELHQNPPTRIDLDAPDEAPDDDAAPADDETAPKKRRRRPSSAFRGAGAAVPPHVIDTWGSPPAEANRFRLYRIDPGARTSAHPRGGVQIQFTEPGESQLRTSWALHELTPTFVQDRAGPGHYIIRWFRVEERGGGQTSLGQTRIVDFTHLAPLGRPSAPVAPTLPAPSPVASSSDEIRRAWAIADEADARAVRNFERIMTLAGKLGERPAPDPGLVTALTAVAEGQKALAEAVAALGGRVAALEGGRSDEDDEDDEDEDDEDDEAPAAAAAAPDPMGQLASIVAASVPSIAAAIAERLATPAPVRVDPAPVQAPAPAAAAPAPGAS